jgi:hypothetical protein
MKKNKASKKRSMVVDALSTPSAIPGRGYVIGEEK